MAALWTAALLSDCEPSQSRLDAGIHADTLSHSFSISSRFCQILTTVAV